jgi:hypothetical protein
MAVNADRPVVEIERVTDHVPCMACGYDLFGLARRNDRALCPECGRETDIHWRRWAAPRELRAREAAGMCGFSVILMLLLAPTGFLFGAIVWLVLGAAWLSACLYTMTRYPDVRGVAVACVLRSAAVLLFCLALLTFIAGVFAIGWLDAEGALLSLTLSAPSGLACFWLWRFSRRLIRLRHRNGKDAACG